VRERGKGEDPLQFLKCVDANVCVYILLFHGPLCTGISSLLAREVAVMKLAGADTARQGVIDQTE